MVSPEYYRRQAELCLQLALTCADQATAIWLVGLAKNYKAKARAGRPAAAESNVMPGYMIGVGRSSIGGRDRDQPRSRALSGWIESESSSFF
jgi:hypothetical protein